MKNEKILNFVKKTELASIQLVATEFVMHIPPELIAKEALNYTFEHRSQHLLIPAVKDNSSSRTQLFCFVQTFIKSSEMDMNDGTGKKEFAYTGSCKFVVRYLLEEESSATEDLLSEFCQNFSVPHAYPYIRAHVESQFSQMGLMGITLPLYKAAPTHPLISDQST